MSSIALTNNVVIDSNNLGIYPDVGNVLTNIALQNQSWTATQDCFVIAGVSYANYPINLNGGRIDTDQAGYSIFETNFYAKKGDVISGKVYCGLRVYGLR